MAFKCDTCDKTFVQAQSLRRHQTSAHGDTSHNCDRCEASFKRKDALTRHMKRHTEEKRHECNGCSKKFHRKDKRDEHQMMCVFTKREVEEEKKRKADEELEEPPPKVQKTCQVGDGQGEPKVDDVDACLSALNNSLKEIEFKPRIGQKHDLDLFLSGKKKPVLNNVGKALDTHKGIKWYISVQVKFIKHKVDGDDVISEPYFRSICFTEVNSNDLQTHYEKAIEKIKEAFETFQKEGSGWVLSEVLKMSLYLAKYTPLKGSSYIPLPKVLRNKKVIVNVQNTDNKCFMWSILAALHPVSHLKKQERIHHYQPYIHELNFEGIEFPVRVDQIAKFERQNSISVNVYGYENKSIFPCHQSKETFERQIDLLLISQGSTNHYCLIKDLDRFLSSQTKNHNRMFYCRPQPMQSAVQIQQRP